MNPDDGPDVAIEEPELIGEEKAGGRLQRFTPKKANIPELGSGQGPTGLAYARQ